MSGAPTGTDVRSFDAPGQMGTDIRAAAISCWVEVSNAGGAAGFPFPPVDNAEVVRAFDQIIEGLAPQRSRVVAAFHGGQLVGWLNIRRNVDALIAHWGTLHHVQTHLAVRGLGVGRAMLEHTRRLAREEMHIEQIHLAARGGIGLETFYASLGWKEIGRRPCAYRLSPGDDRDEVLMMLAPL